jgi:hypothetical protein
MGNEIRGVSNLVRQSSALRVSLPCVGMVQSYNVSVAGAIMLSLLHAGGVLKGGFPLSNDEKDAMLANWLIGDVPASHVILARHNLRPADL